MSVIRARLGWLLAVWLVLALPSQAFAHASLLASDPANDAVLLQPPASLTLTFNEPVAPLLVRILDAKGVVVTPRVERRGNSLVLLPASALEAGAYVVSWRVISDDGHPVGGAVTFWVGARIAAAPQVTNAENAPVRAAIWMSRLFVYLGLFVGIGGAFFLAWMSMPPSMPGPRIVSAVASIAGLTATLVSIGLQGLDGLAAPFGALLLPEIWKAGVQGSFGRAAAMAMAGFIAALLSLRLRNRYARVLSLVSLIAAGVSLAASGHAATAEPRVLAIAAVVLHGMSLAFWIGALVPLACILRYRGDANTPLQLFSRAILYAVAALLLSGGFLAVVQVQHVASLWSTDYGRILLVKLGLVAGLLMIALWNRAVLTPRIMTGAEPPRRRMRNAIIGELILIAVILGVVGLWRFSPPPRLLAAMADDFFVHIHSGKAMANATITPGVAGPVEIVVQLETPDERPLTAMELSITLSNPDLGIEPTTAKAQRMDDGRWRARLTATVPGRWMLGLGILVSDFDKVDVEAPILIK